MEFFYLPFVDGFFSSLYALKCFVFATRHAKDVFGWCINGSKPVFGCFTFDRYISVELGSCCSFGTFACMCLGMPIMLIWNFHTLNRGWCFIFEWHLFKSTASKAEEFKIEQVMKHYFSFSHFQLVSTKIYFHFRRVCGFGFLYFCEFSPLSVVII